MAYRMGINEIVYCAHALTDRSIDSFVHRAD